MRRTLRPNAYLRLIENPWTKAHWNLTHQGQIFRQDKAEADRLARAAGHRTARLIAK
jgi:hypothetical protein